MENRNWMCWKKAKEAENNNDWFQAAQYWLEINQQDDADACMRIYESNKRGDEYYALVIKIMNGKTEEQLGISRMDEIYREAWNEIFEQYCGIVGVIL